VSFSWHFNLFFQEALSLMIISDPDPTCQIITDLGPGQTRTVVHFGFGSL